MDVNNSNDSYEALTHNQLLEERTIMEELVKRFNELAKVIAASKGLKLKEMDADAILAFAVVGFKEKCYRKNYNSSKNQQLKAIKDMLRDKGQSLEDFLDELKDKE